mgnify:CR=1 FL=1
MSQGDNNEHERKRVAAGAKFMDEILPGWYKQVNLKTLEMGNGNLCILGQTFGVHAEKCLAKKMYPKEWKEAFEGVQRAWPYHYNQQQWGYSMAIKTAYGIIPKWLKARGRDSEKDPEFQVLQQVCAGHDNRCFWSEEVASRLAKEPEESTHV